MKTVQDLGFKVNTKRNGKSHNDRNQHSYDRFERKANVAFKTRKARLAQDFYQ